MIILIPAYEPGARLVALVRDLRTTSPGLETVVVDDGSGPAYAPVFAEAAALGAIVLAHRTNRGKGYALKRGFAFIAEHFPGQAVVCADSDGQHLVGDILRVAAGVEREGDAIVLGARQFTGRVPARSRLGNEATRLALAVATGLRLRDTQTGLRGYPAAVLPWLGTVPGDRFEYEMTALLRAHRDRRRIVEVPIQTVYLEHNASSHFRPLADSVRVYAPLLRFALSSIVAFALDFALLLVLDAWGASLLLAVVGARVGSSLVNFAANRRLVFREGRAAPLAPAAARYYALATSLLAANFVMLEALTAGLGLPLIGAKVATEGSLFLVSYVVQKRHVFAGRGGAVVVRAQGDDAPAGRRPRTTTSGAPRPTGTSMTSTWANTSPSRVANADDGAADHTASTPPGARARAAAARPSRS